MSNKIVSRRQRTSSCDFDDIDESEVGDVATPVNQSTSKMDVEALLRKSKETRDKIKRNLTNTQTRNDTQPAHTDSLDIKNPHRQRNSVPLSLHAESEPEVPQPKPKHKRPHEAAIDLSSSENQRQIAKSEYHERKMHTMEYPFPAETHDIDPNNLSNPYLAHSHTVELGKEMPKTTRDYRPQRGHHKQPQKHVSISMNETPGRFIHNYRSKRGENNTSPSMHSGSRISYKASPMGPLTNRSSTSTKPYNFRIGNLNTSGRYALTTPKKSSLKTQSRIPEKPINNVVDITMLQQQLEHEK